MIELPNIINGCPVTSDQKQILRSYDNEVLGALFDTTPSQIRSAKRGLSIESKNLSSIPVEKVIHVISQSASFLLRESSEIHTLARLTGSPVSYLNRSLEAVRHWLTNSHAFVTSVFGHTNYDAAPAMRLHDRLVRKIYHPKGPVIAILPRNEEIAAIYVLAQLMLARVPAIIKTSSQGASSYCAHAFLESVRRVIARDQSLEPLVRAYSIVNILDQDKSKTIEKLHVEHATYIIFGSDATVESISNQLSALNAKGILIKLGTGFSTSIVLEDAHIDHAVEQVALGAAADKGNKCTSTTLCYVHERVYHEFKMKLSEQAALFALGDPMDEQTSLGWLDKESLAAIQKHTLEVGAKLENIGSTLHVVELEGQLSCKETPGPVVFLKKVGSATDALQLLRLDLENNCMTKNLTTSVFTESHEKFSALAELLPSHTVRQNSATTNISLFAPHQGTFILREIMDLKTLEIPLTQDLNTQKRMALSKEVTDSAGANTLRNSWV